MPVDLPQARSRAGRPEAHEIAPFYLDYLNLTSSDDPVEELKTSGIKLVRLLDAIPAEKAGYRYQEGKWSVIELLLHMIDTERVFAYRALTFARGDDIVLPGFEQDDWIAPSDAGNRELSDLREEFVELRYANIRMLAGLPPEAWTRLGTASGKRFSVRVLAFIMSGHVLHHVKVLKERYGLG